jgi:ectoine hydroxylase-related dioxygenase (phytanoyl-CoA dioxygenase family)
MTATPHILNEVDARGLDCIGDGHADAFRRDGYLVIRNVVAPAELAALRAAGDELVRESATIGPFDPDFQFGRGARSGSQVFKRVEYVISRKEPMRLLLGHPFVLRSVEKVQGRSFIPTWDSMVVKMPGEGIIVPWHRDAEPPRRAGDPRPIFNVDFYLDEADLKTCLWVIPGSNRWTSEDAHRRCAEPGFRMDDAVPVPMNPGDVILHDVLVLHGSPEGDGNALRRTVYFEFRPCDVEADLGPHTPPYLRLKQQVLLRCMAERAAASFATAEKPFAYAPDAAFDPGPPSPPSRLRFPHPEFWREDA